MIAIIIDLIKSLAIIIVPSILLFIITRYYGIWNVLVYTPIIVIIFLFIYAGWYGGLVFIALSIPILGIYYIVLSIIKYYNDKNPPVNNRRSNNNRSNNTRTSTAEYLN